MNPDQRADEVVLREISLDNFRNHRSTRVTFAPGLTVITGDNGQGKTNLLEAIGWMATQASFRGASTDTLVAVGADSAVIRMTVDVGQRERLIEAELTRRGRNRIQVNKQPLRRARDMFGTMRVVVFSPDDLAIVKAGPSERRRFLDDCLASTHLRAMSDRADLDRILKQRNTVLKQAGPRGGPDVDATLDVWDAKLAETGERVASARERLVEMLNPKVEEIYRTLGGSGSRVDMRYQRSWSDDLAGALAAARHDDLKRKVTTVGPHRDELEIWLDGLLSRTHSSQGEQRTIALALRLASQRVIAAAVGAEPIVLLDDVFSELDDQRTKALMNQLPATQTILTTATGSVPSGVAAARSYSISDGVVTPVAPTDPSA